jgi:transcriptional regulator with XRE-family HTH domain
VNLRDERVNRGFTIRGLAKEIGVTEQTVRRLENGEIVRPANAKKVADFFECKVTDLMPIDGASS